MDPRVAAEVARLMDRAARALHLAENYRDEFRPDAVSRAYYAMFYAASAALFSEGVRRHKHSGVIAAFGERFSRSGAIGREHHRALVIAFKDREIADYQVMVEIEAERVERRITEARAFVGAVRGLLTSRGFSPQGG